MKTIPAKYINVPTQGVSGKNAPTNNAITGSFAPQGINGVSIAVALLSLSFRMVRHAMMPGIAHPVPITSGITDLPERPTLLNMGSSTTVALAMYPLSSRRAIKKYITITSGRKPTTAPTPPMMPSTRSDCRNGFACSTRPATQSRKVSIQPTSQSAIQVPTVDWEMKNTPNITNAKIGIPSHGFVRTPSILS